MNPTLTLLAALLLAPLATLHAAELVTVYPEAPLPHADAFTVQVNGKDIPSIMPPPSAARRLPSPARCK